MLGEREVVGRAEVARLEEDAARLTVLIEQCRWEVERLATASEVLSGLAEDLPGAQPAGRDLRPEPILVDQLLTILAQAGRSVRCKDVVAALGEDPPAPHPNDPPEQTRSHLRRIDRIRQQSRTGL